jgi:hypothetical protein
MHLVSHWDGYSEGIMGMNEVHLCILTMFEHIFYTFCRGGRRHVNMIILCIMC